MTTVARLVPALVHVRCAYCAYECLLFRNSLLTSMYRSPFDEHKARANSVKCAIYLPTSKESSDELPARDKTGTQKEDHHQWLQQLLDLGCDKSRYTRTSNVSESEVSMQEEPKASETKAATRLRVQDILVEFSGSSNGDDLTVRKMPDVIEQLVRDEESKHMEENRAALPVIKKSISKLELAS